ncbi:hypothetical protein GNY06_08435 [Elizabethkingia argentiflava]|uniref:TerB-C domain-containing protein n=1 Tax=Elizabethkingia argenteiflava TaxID=2681556 RepID=A0A845PY66_9FLAO|nr:TerB N-terminal domain-containing protein [Elizabethkingia argenteiflava]NAW51407.1 hypothetical protein [Elizabethkingia argenteiflava]
MSGNSYYTDQKICYDVDENRASQGSNSHNWDYVPSILRVENGMFIPKMKGIENAPQQIRQLIQMFEEEPWSLMRKKSFYEHALFMEGYEDDAEIVPFSEYFPVYRSMDIAQLRSYFTFRRLLRQGEYLNVPLSYIFVYIYEILMQIGVANPEVGLETLKNLKIAYGPSQPKLIRYLDLWMQDYVVYYGLTNRFDEFFAQEKQEDDLALLLSSYREVDESALFETACAISSYKIKNGALFKKHPNDVVSVVARTIKAIVPIYEQRFRQPIEHLCLGLRKRSPHPMFASAVFFRPDSPKEKTVNISLRRSYYCKGGLWSMDTFREKVFPKKGDLISLILHETDRKLRISMNIKSSMIGKMSDPIVENAIQQEINSYFQEKAEEARPKIKVDFSKLDKIRSDAAVIRDALLSEEDVEKDLVYSEEQPAGTTKITDEPSATMENKSMFSKDEREFLHLLLNAGDWKNYLRGIRLPIGVITDSINEKTMEDIQDILIVYEGDGPTILNDYKDYIISNI